MVNQPDIKCAEELYNTRVKDGNLKLTEPVTDLYIANVFRGIIPQKYDIDIIKQASKETLDKFAEAFGIETNVSRIIRILRFLGVLIEKNPFADFPLDIRRRIALNLEYEIIADLCLVSQEFAELCQDTDFWRTKAMVDFNISAADFNSQLSSFRRARITYLYFKDKRTIQLAKSEIPVGGGAVLLAGINPTITSEYIMIRFAAPIRPILKVIKFTPYSYIIIYNSIGDVDTLFEDFIRHSGPFSYPEFAGSRITDFRSPYL